MVILPVLELIQTTFGAITINARQVCKVLTAHLLQSSMYLVHMLYGNANVT